MRPPSRPILTLSSLWLALLLVVSLTGTASAQDTATVASPTALRSTPATNADTLEILPAGSTVTAVRHDGNWWLVTTAAGRQGYVHEQFLRLNGGAAPPSPAPGTSRSPAAPATQTGRPPATPPRPAPGRTPPAAPGVRQPRGFVAAGVMMQPGKTSFVDQRSTSVFRETATWSGSYEVESGVGADVGVFARLWNNLGLGVAVTSASRAGDGAIAASYPHPFFFGRPRTADAEIPDADRTETAVHVSAALLVPTSSRLRIALFAGPSLYSISQTLADDLRVTDEYPYDTITVAPAGTTDVSESVVGFHAGGDVSWYVTERVGAGLLVRYAAATKGVSVGGGDEFDLKGGGIQIGVGLRLRF